MTTKKKHTKWNDESKERKFQWWSWISLLFGLSAFATGPYGLREIDNYFQEAKFTVLLSFMGIAAGLIFYYLVLCPLVTGLIHFKDPNWSLPAGFILGFVGISLALGIYMNSHLSTTKFCKDFKVERKSQGGARHTSNYLFITIHNKQERLECTSDFWNSIEENQYINLCIIQGALGYDYITITDELKAKP